MQADSNTSIDRVADNVEVSKDNEVMMRRKIQYC
jgi:hypothetical protein